MKILSPAGNLESLKAAIINGADEVYLGINNFNARNNIDGFNIDNLKEAVDYAHIFNVKVNLAINILFDDSELNTALDTIIEAYNIGVDSFIIQDLGLASLVHENFPEIEIHASTQMGLHNLEGVQSILKYGFKRIVLARETPLEEIKRIKQNTGVEIEYFAQGALCVCFSGNCYLSSYLLNASGNRGKCKQLCRLPYTLFDKNKKIKQGYLLSAKDFNMLNKLNELKNAGVDVLKIEGRARRPFYVAAATSEYRKAIDGLNPNVDNIKLGFNRNYTAGYFDGNDNIISEYQSHIGINIGKVVKVVPGKKFNEVVISSNRPLSAKSTFKFFEKNLETATLSAYDLKEVSKNTYKLTTTNNNIKVGNSVNLISDYDLENQILTTTKKLPITIDIFAKANSKIKAIIKYNNECFEILGEVLESANTRPITKEEFNLNFKKSDLFDAYINFVEFENIFMTKQKLNEFRRTIYDNLFSKITQKYRHNLSKKKITINNKLIKFNDFKIIENLNESFDSLNIIFSPSVYNLSEIKTFINMCKKLNKNAFLDTPNFALENDIKLLKNIINETDISIVANNYYALNLTNNFIIGAGLNIYNHISANIYNKPVITAESVISNQIKYPYMTLRHCPMKSHLNASCETCPYHENFTYKMDNGKILKLKRKKLSTCTFYLTD